MEYATKAKLERSIFWKGIISIVFIYECFFYVIIKNKFIFTMAPAAGLKMFILTLFSQCKQ